MNTDGLDTVVLSNKLYKTQARCACNTILKVIGVDLDPLCATVKCVRCQSQWQTGRITEAEAIFLGEHLGTLVERGRPVADLNEPIEIEEEEADETQGDPYMPQDPKTLTGENDAEHPSDPPPSDEEEPGDFMEDLGDKE